MKIKNIAFFGVMAAILSVGSAARADSTTVIASQAYVDAKDALKQDKLKSGTGGNISVDDTSTTAASRVVTSITASGDGQVTVNTAPIDVSGSITTALDGLDLTNPNGDGVITEVSQNNGQVSATRGLVGTNAISNGAITTDKIANSNVTMGKTDFIVKQGNNPETPAWNTATESQTNDDEKALWAANIEGDDYVPTVAAVEKRVLAAESRAGGAISNLNLTNPSGDGVITEVSQSNGQVSATRGLVGTSAIAADAVTTAKIADENVTTAKLDAGAVTHAKLAADAVEAGNIKDGEVGTDELAANAVTTAKIADGNVTAGKLATDSVTTVKIADGNVTSAKLADGAITTDKIANSNVTMGKTDFIVKQGNNPETPAWNTATESQTNDDEKALWAANIEGDDYVPTVAAVEKRVLAAESRAGGAINNLNASASGTGTVIKDVSQSNGLVSATKGYIVNTDVDTNAAIEATKSVLSSTYATASTNEAVAAADSVETAISKLAKKAADNETNISTNTTAITTLNGTVSDAGSVLKSIKDNAESATFTPGNSGITATNLADAIKEVKTTAATGVSNLDNNGMTANNQPVVTVNQTDGLVTATRGTITYTDAMDYKLSNVDTTGGDAHTSCTKGSPCTLTMIWDSQTSKPIYEWTNMDTENTDALL